MTEVPGPRPRVVVIDGDGDVRDLLEAMLGVADGLHLVAVAADVETGLARVAEAQPDVVVLDLDLPEGEGEGGEGIPAVARLRAACPGSRIVVFSAFPDPLTLVEVLRRGADEYLDKARAWADLVPTIELLCAGAGDPVPTAPAPAG
jgi:DNA-binding NarL/FixJ family response regulator